MWKRRAIAVTVVASAAIVAAAVPDGSVVATPNARVVLANSATATLTPGSTTFTNTTATPKAIETITRVSCDPAILDGPTPFPFIIPGNGSAMRSFSCQGPNPPGMKRCLWQGSAANGDGIVDWMGICEFTNTGAGGSDLTPRDAMTNALIPKLDFGNVPIGAPLSKAFVIQSGGNGTSGTIDRLFFQLDSLSGDFLIGSPCMVDSFWCDRDLMLGGGSNSQTVTITCDPQKLGLRTARLHVASDDNTFMLPLLLECNGTAGGGPVLHVSTPAIDLTTPVEVVGGSIHQSLQISNIGSGTTPLKVTNLQIDSVDPMAALDWTYVASGACGATIDNSCQLLPTQAIDLDITFDPMMMFRRRASLTISYNDGTPGTAVVLLTGIGAGATLEYDGDSPLDFGTIPVNGSGSLTFDLRNNGNRTTTAMLGVAQPPGPFSLNPTGNVQVQPMMPRTITAKCAPTAEGTFMTTFSISGSDAPAPITVDATCHGTTNKLYANPSAIMLGEVRKGTMPAPKTIQLLSAAAPMQVTLSGEPHLKTDSDLLHVGSASMSSTPATFTLTVDPQHEAVISNAIVVDNNDGPPLEIPITGKVVTASYVTPPMVDLGTFCINLPTTPSNVLLTSTGTGSIGMPIAPKLDGGTASQFELALTNPPSYSGSTLIAPGGAASVSIAPKRQSVATTANDNLIWTTDVEGMTTATTELAAHFVDRGAAIAPGELDFGNEPIHTDRDNAQRVMIQNCDTVALQIDTPRIPSPFRLDSPPPPMTLQPSDTATFSVGFHPTTPRTYVEELVIESPGLAMPLKVILRGTGVTGSGDDAGSGSNRLPATSFYACSCRSSNVAASWPVPLAVLCAVLRRRRRR